MVVSRRVLLLLSSCIIVSRGGSSAILITPPATTLSLNGRWSFALDPQNVGYAAGWQNPAVGEKKLLERITVPGFSIGAAGFGNSTAIKLHEYAGVSWFSKVVTLPAAWLVIGGAGGSSLALRVGGVKDQAEFWEGGAFIGNHSGFNDGFEIDLTPTLRRLSSSADNAPAQLQLTARVSGCSAQNPGYTDSGAPCSCMGGCFTSLDSGPWTGIWGNVELIHRSPLALDNLTVLLRKLPQEQQSDTVSEAAIATVSVSASIGNGIAELELEQLAATKVLDVAISEHGGANQEVLRRRIALSQITISREGSSLTFELELQILEPKLWAPAHPSLYHADVQLLEADGDTVVGGSHAHVRFGLRKMTIEGSHFLLNGKRHFLVGTGDDFGYINEAPPMNKTLYMQRFGAMKTYGFDFIRLHSHFESQPFFDAADEVSERFQIPLPVKIHTRYIFIRHDVFLQGGASGNAHDSPVFSYRRPCPTGAAATTTCFAHGSGRFTRSATTPASWISQ
jgi:hypothetical protein